MKKIVLASLLGALSLTVASTAMAQEPAKKKPADPMDKFKSMSLWEPVFTGRR